MSRSTPYLRPVSKKNVIRFDRQNHDLEKTRNALGYGHTGSARNLSALPFSLEDTTVGVENELQTVVIGARETVDLPKTIRESNYYKNVLRRISTGDFSRDPVMDLDRYLDANPTDAWENSWVRFPMACLCPYARKIFSQDILSDKSLCDGPFRRDAHRFTVTEGGEPHLRIPISYLLKLALADAIGCSDVPPLVRKTGEKIMGHFLNDNTSPETFSFYPVSLARHGRPGDGIARESLKRFLLSQFLTFYGNARFRLGELGQRAMIYFAPHPPIRQKLLNETISDAFYRELFMSPCLSGWDRGEEKHRYMTLCHQVLSRSQLNAVAKLKEAGIITSNLVVLPNMSNISLANNGTHISLGSRKLTALLADKGSGFTGFDEKYYGDLAIKIIEHFLPLFVGTYSAAPYRLDFMDFHSEKALGFLPHELDFTHLRMFWRRWKKKASLSFMGRPMTPFGPESLDRWVSRLLGLKGDLVADFRLIDYPAALMSTDQSPALDGRPGNDVRLKQDLADLGVFDDSMAIYLLYRMRAYETIGFSGFEGRHHSLFHDLETDMCRATGLQALVTALAYRYILEGRVDHGSIPDDPFVESERRQIFFGSAAGIPTFFIRRNTRNRFMIRLLEQTRETRSSRRYKGYIRVRNLEYRRALIRILRSDGADLIDQMGLEETVADLEHRTGSETESAAGKLVKEILDTAGATSPYHLSAQEFNTAAESYYRNRLRRRHLESGLAVLKEDLRRLDSMEMWRGGGYARPLLKLLGGRDASEFLTSVSSRVMAETASADELKLLIHLLILTVHNDIGREKAIDGDRKKVFER